MCKVCTDVGGIKQFYHDCPPVRKIIHSLKIVDYLHVQVDNPWYNYYMLYTTLELRFDFDSHCHRVSFEFVVLALVTITEVVNFQPPSAFYPIH